MEELLLLIPDILAHPLGSNGLLVVVIIFIAKAYRNGLLEDKKRLREENDGLREQVLSTNNYLTKDEFQQFTKSHDEVHNGIKKEVHRVEMKVDGVGDKVGEVNEKLIHLDAKLGAKKE